MSITSFIKKVCVQTAIYWGNPQPDGYGGYIYDAPVEIKCRWEDSSDVINTHFEGLESNNKSEIMLTQNVDVEGYLYLGSLTDTFDTGTDLTKPSTVKGAHLIYSVSRVPLFASTKEFVYNATLKILRRV